MTNKDEAKGKKKKFKLHWQRCSNNEKIEYLGSKQIDYQLKKYKLMPQQGEIENWKYSYPLDYFLSFKNIIPLRTKLYILQLYTKKFAYL